jgi:hypothetical protein
LAKDGKAAVAAGNGRKVDGAGGGFAEDHIAAASVGTCERVVFGSPHDQIRQAVAVHITGTGHAEAGLIVTTLAVDHEAISAASRDGGELNGHQVGFTEDHIAATGIGKGPGSHITEACSHEEIRQAVAVDITGTGHTPAG